MSNLDPRIEAVRVQYGLEKNDFWQIPQNKQWVCKHAALEIVATKANIEWSAPQIIEARTGDGIAVLAVTGKMGDRIEWATGEASPKNNKNAYPWAMAEKRAKDRVVLKLVGIHGLVYSEDEMPPSVDTSHAPSSGSNAQSKPATKIDEARDLYDSLVKSMRQNTTRYDVKSWWSDPDCQSSRSRLPTDWQKNLQNEFFEYGASLPETNKEAA